MLSAGFSKNSGCFFEIGRGYVKSLDLTFTCVHAVFKVKTAFVMDSATFTCSNLQTNAEKNCKTT